MDENCVDWDKNDVRIKEIKHKINELEIMKNDLKQNNKNNISVRNSEVRGSLTNGNKNDDEKYEE